MLTTERAFLLVVESGSFKRAAEHLGVETSSLSRRVAALEQRLSVKLLHRSTSRTRPTELGQRYYEGLRRLVDDQAALEAQITGERAQLTGRLRVGATPDFAERYIAPVLPALCREAPTLSVELTLSSDLDNLGEQHLDVAFRLGPMPDSGLIARPVGEIPRVLVASPAYLERRGTPDARQSLASHDFLLYTPDQSRHGVAFADGERVGEGELRGPVTANSLRAIRALVLAGVGLNWGPRWIYADDLAAGRLVEILPQHPVAGFRVSAVYPARDWVPGKTREIIRRVAARIAEAGD